MVKWAPAFGLLSVIALASASPVKRQDSTAAVASTAVDTAASTAADTAASTGTDTAASTGTDTAASTGTDTAATTSAASSDSAAATGTSAAPETTITAFVPSPGGPPNATLYAVTGANETYLVGLEPVTAVDEGGATTTVVLEDIFVVSEDGLDLYVFDDQGNPLEATECQVNADGTTAVCNGVVVDLAAQAIAVFSNLTISGASSGIPAYLPTGTADPSGISAASNAPALISSFTAEGGASATSIDAGNATLTSQTTTTATAFPGATEGTVAGESASTGTEASTGTDASSAESSAADTAAATDTAAASSAAATTTA